MSDCIFEVKHYGQNVREYRHVNLAPDITPIDLHAILAGVIAILCVFIPQINALGWLLIKLFCVYGVISILLKVRKVKDESILVMRGLGIQIKKATFLGVQSEEFIELGRIQDVFIHEAFKMWDVVFYIGIVVKGSKTLSIPFEHMYPNLPQLLTALGGMRALLFDEEEAIQIHQKCGVTFIQNFPYNTVDLSRVPPELHERILFLGSKRASDGIVPDSKTSEHSSIIGSITVCDESIKFLEVDMPSANVNYMISNKTMSPTTNNV